MTYELVDETAGEKVRLVTDADLAVLFMSTPDAWRGYELAAEFRGRGVTVLVSRGCKFQCSYCTIPGFFNQFRTRPVGAIVDEIRNSGLKYVELHADNLIADRDYALELFTALKPLNIYWAGETTINIAQHEDVLQAAAESGRFYLVVGLETASQPALKAAGKGFVVFEPKQMSADQLCEGRDWFYTKHNSLGRWFKRRRHQPAALKWMNVGVGT